MTMFTGRKVSPSRQTQGPSNWQVLKDVEVGRKILQVGYLTLYLKRSHIFSSLGFQPVNSGFEVTGHWSKTILSLLG